jgi:hypothetical protein
MSESGEVLHDQQKAFFFSWLKPVQTGFRTLPFGLARDVLVIPNIRPIHGDRADECRGHSLRRA